MVGVAGRSKACITCRARKKGVSSPHPAPLVINVHIRMLDEKVYG